MLRTKLACTAAIALCACGPRGTTVSRDANGDMTMTRSDAQVSTVAHVSPGGLTAAPADLPAWAPVYPGAKVSQVVEQSAGGASMKNVILMTTDKPQTVMAFYDRSIAAAGLKPSLSAGQPDAPMRAVTMPSGQTGTVIVGQTEDGTAISIGYQIKH